MTHGPTKSYYMENITLKKILTQNHILKEANFLYNNHVRKVSGILRQLLKSVRLVVPERKYLINYFNNNGSLYY